MDAASILTALLPALNANATADLQWWTVDQLYAYMADALAVLGRAVPIFAGVQSGSTSTAENTFPGISCVAVAWNGTALRPATVRELEALDPAWDTATAANPTRWTEDVGPGSIRLYPAPTGSGTLKILHHGAAPRLATGSTTFAAFSITSEILWYATLASARNQTGETYLPDVSAIATGQAALLSSVAKAYWGAAI